MNKFTTEVVWHRCNSYPPEEGYNPKVYLTDGSKIFVAEYIKKMGFCIDNVWIDADKYWWADLLQIVNKEGRFNEG